MASMDRVMPSLPCIVQPTGRIEETTETRMPQSRNGSACLSTTRAAWWSYVHSISVEERTYSLRQSIRTRRPTPTSGTVQINVEEIDVDGVSLRVYDCAGQVAFTGLLQMFLSARAVSLLVCNSGAFGQRDGYSSDGNPLDLDLVKLHELRVCDWLGSLSFRIPDSNMIVVATKCDQAFVNAAHMAERMERADRKWQEYWSDANMRAVRVEDGVGLTNCIAQAEGDAASKERTHAGETMRACDWREDMRDGSPPSLLRRIMYNSKGDLRGGGYGAS